MALKKELVETLTEIQKKRLTATNIARALLIIMKNHIGENKAISRSKLYRTLFCETDMHDLKSDLRWLYVGKAFNYLRKRTKCFCTSGNEGSKYYYFVIQNESDAAVYKNILERNIKAMRVMQRKSLMAVKGKWYKEDWHLPGEETPLVKKRVINLLK
jgi:hypothetical protein